MSAPHRFQRSGGDSPLFVPTATLLDVHRAVIAGLDEDLVAHAHEEAVRLAETEGVTVPALGSCVIRACRVVTPRAHSEIGGGLQFSFTLPSRVRRAVNVQVYGISNGLVAPEPRFEERQADQVGRAVERVAEICALEGIPTIPELTHRPGEEPMLITSLHHGASDS